MCRFRVEFLILLFVSLFGSVLVPSLDRSKVDPQLFERRFDQLQGLARLLLLERLSTPEKRFE